MAGMKSKRIETITGILVLSVLLILASSAYSDDTCIFSVTADDVPPYIVLLLDNGAEMEQIIWHSNYNSASDYTAVGSVFSNPGGYALNKSGNTYYLYEIQPNLTLSNTGIASDGTTPTWTINGRTITLPAVPSASVDANGVKDNATQFRYASNYLNWLFYSGNYTGDGSDLPSKTRFYYAKLAIMKVAKMTANRAKFGIYNFTSNSSGASNVQPLGLVVDEPLAADPANNVLDSNFVNNINNMGTVTYSPLAEGLATVGGYYASNSSGVVEEYCSKLFSLVISPGVSSMDRDVPSQSSVAAFSDYDADGEGTSLTISGTTYTIPTNENGTTWLDDVAAYHYTNDIVGYSDGFQRVYTYTLGFMGDDASNAFLANASNNGNGNFNLYDDTDPEYGKYHYTADNPDNLADELLAAINDILENTTTFTAPVVPVTRTTSGDRIYMALFKPNAGNFWEGNLAKFGLLNNINGEPEIVDSNGAAATWPNGALKETASPYWETKHWADPTKSNYIHNQNRGIFSYFGITTDITSSFNAFSNGNVNASLLDNPTDITVNGITVSGVDKVINFIRGADVLDEDDDNDTTENRAVITGDILHSEPAVVSYSNSTINGSVIFYGSNDGMLHAVLDSDGTEMWGFIPPDLLPRLKDILEGTSHPYYVDSSPRVFIDGDQDTVVEVGEQAILVFGERSGGDHYWALDITDPTAPAVLWSVAPSVSLNLGQTWSEPVFTRVKTSDNDLTGTDVMVVGGGYSADNSTGNLVAVIDVFTGAVVKKFEGMGMGFSIPSSVAVIDLDSNGYADKMYVGDMGGQMLRFGRFTEDDGTTPLEFPDTNENVNDWNSHILFDTADTRKIFYPPSVTLERGYDLVFFGTGDRNDACNPATDDRIYAVMDDHSDYTVDDLDLVDITDPAAAPPTFTSDKGYYIQLGPGEKVLAEGMVFNKVYYITSFDPNNSDPCKPGGLSRLYAFEYKTGVAVIDFDGDGHHERSTDIGGGIPSKPVMIIPAHGSAKLLVSVGSTNADVASEGVSAGIVSMDPLLPPRNFFYLWWSDV
jgi:type IV pilus assembly protein PilY1